MILSSDYHTHTKYSHGKGTIIENAIVAKQKGLKKIAKRLPFCHTTNRCKSIGWHRIKRNFN